jgi:hypothetical protein
MQIITLMSRIVVDSAKGSRTSAFAAPRMGADLLPGIILPGN